MKSEGFWRTKCLQQTFLPVSRLLSGCCSCSLNIWSMVLLRSCSVSSSSSSLSTTPLLHWEVWEKTRTNKRLWSVISDLNLNQDQPIGRQQSAEFRMFLVIDSDQWWLQTGTHDAVKHLHLQYPSTPLEGLGPLHLSELFEQNVAAG